MRKEEEKEMAEMVRNPELYRKKMLAMELARKRQQEKYEEAARAMAEREREKEEEKRRQRLEQLENLVNYSSFGLFNDALLRDHQPNDHNSTLFAGSYKKFLCEFNEYFYISFYMYMLSCILSAN